MDRCLIYGGTFDPVHLGHVETLKAVQAHFQFDSIKIIPCKIPLLKAPSQAPVQARLEMLKLILPEIKHATIDTIELDRDTPSYTVDTLKQLHQNAVKPTEFTLLLGQDAFESLPQWKDWEELLTLCRVLVVTRGGCPNVIQNTHVIPRCARDDVGDFFNAGHYPISSSDIRQRIAMGQNCDDLLPPKVAAYIKSQGLYQAQP